MKQSKKQQKDVINYYNSTKREYKTIWKNDDNLGIHFGYYDDQNRDHNSAILNINRKLAEIAKITAKDKVFDAGCGVGGTSIWLAENIGCRATGITIVPWQFEKAQKLITRKNLSEKVQVLLGDFADTKQKAKSYDVFIGLESIVHAEDKLDVIKEAYRVLKPGGRLLICEYMLESDNMNKNDNDLIQRWLDGWSMPSLLTQEHYKELAKKANFKIVKFDDWTEPVRPSFNRLNKFVRLLMPYRKVLRFLRIVNDGQITNLMATDAQMISLEHGLWR